MCLCYCSYLPLSRSYRPSFLPCCLILRPGSALYLPCSASLSVYDARSLCRYPCKPLCRIWRTGRYVFLIGLIGPTFVLFLSSYLPCAMKDLPVHTDRRRSSLSSWVMLRRLAAYALLAVVGFRCLSSSSALLSGDSLSAAAYDAAQNVAWLLTPLSKDPWKRALQLMTRQPVIGQVGSSPVPRGERLN